MRYYLTEAWLRRTFTILSTLLLLLLISGCGEDESVDPDGSAKLIVASYGGTYQDAQRIAFFEPYSQASGTTLIEAVYDGGYGTFKDSISGTPKWDVVDVEGNMVILGEGEGLLEPIDYSVVPTAGLLPNAVTDYGVGVMSFSYILAYQTDQVTAEQVANPWRALFDPTLVPGPRGLHDEPRRTLEIALMADGVAPENLYPLDLDRAFSVLTELRDAMKSAGTPIVWWDTYAEPQALLANGTVVITPGVNGRLIAAQKSGEKIGITWQDGILDFDWWVVPKGITHRDEAMKFLAYAVSAEAQAALSQAIAYGPINEDAWALLPESVSKDLPTYSENVKNQIWFNTEWWVENLATVQARWDAWRAEE